MKNECHGQLVPKKRIVRTCAIMGGFHKNEDANVVTKYNIHKVHIQMQNKNIIHINITVYNHPQILGKRRLNHPSGQMVG